MLPRLAKLLLVVAVLTGGSGCIELTEIITLNSDGRGKIQYEIRMPADMQGGGVSPGGSGKDKTLADLRNESALRTLTKQPGITAWKDVSAEILPDGRIHFKGTAYFDDISQLSSKKNADPFTDHFQLEVTKDVLVLKVNKNKQDDGKKKPAPDFAKMTDAELDDYIMRERVKYQSSKGIIIGMFTDLKIKTVIRLPGKVVDAKNFKKADDRTVVRDLDGNKFVAAVKKFMAQNNAALKLQLKQIKSSELLEHLFEAETFASGSLTVNKLGPDSFNYDKEVKDARAGYPALRQQFHIPDKVRLPGEAMKGTPK